MPYIRYRLKEVRTLGGDIKAYLIPTKTRPIPDDTRCKFCGSQNLVRYGTYRGVQRYMCRDCHRKSADNQALPHKQVRPEIVGSALSMFYEGMSFDSIRRQLKLTYNLEPSKATLYRWVVAYSKIADKIASEIKPKVGKTWVVDETVLKVGGQNLWFWDVLDEKTRFLLASHLSTSRGTKDAETVMKRAQDRVDKPPEFIISDKLAAYLDGIEKVFGADTWHQQSQGFTGKINTNLIERFHGTLKSRTKVMRGMKSRETAKVILAGFLLYYNYLRPHQSLKGKTPAQAAGMDYPYSNWEEIVRGGKKVW